MRSEGGWDRLKMERNIRERERLSDPFVQTCACLLAFLCGVSTKIAYTSSGY